MCAACSSPLSTVASLRLHKLCLIPPHRNPLWLQHPLHSSLLPLLLLIRHPVMAAHSTPTPTATKHHSTCLRGTPHVLPHKPLAALLCSLNNLLFHDNNYHQWPLLLPRDLPPRLLPLRNHQLPTSLRQRMKTSWTRMRMRKILTTRNASRKSRPI